MLRRMFDSDLVRKEMKPFRHERILFCKAQQLKLNSSWGP